jgi:OOP family OmpA-OmpF porin
MENRIKQIYTSIIFILLLIPRLVNAEGIYVGVDLGSTHFSGDGPADTLIFQEGQRFGDTDASYGLHLGYRITDWLAVELGYMDFGSATQQFKISPNVVFIAAPQDTQTLEAKGINLSVIASHDFTSRFSLFGLLGVANIEYENTFSGGFSNVTGSFFSKNAYADQGIIYGVGLKYKMTNAIGLRADLRRNDVGDFILDSATASIEYSF